MFLCFQQSVILVMAERNNLVFIEWSVIVFILVRGALVPSSIDHNVSSHPFPGPNRLIKLQANLRTLT